MEEVLHCLKLRLYPIVTLLLLQLYLLLDQRC